MFFCLQLFSSTVDKTIASNKHVCPPTCEIPARCSLCSHCSPLSLPTTPGCGQIKPFSVFPDYKRGEGSAQNRGEDSSFEAQAEKNNKDAYCGTATNKMKTSSAHLSFCGNKEFSSLQVVAAAAAARRTKEKPPQVSATMSFPC